MISRIFGMYHDNRQTCYETNVVNSGTMRTND